MKHRKGTIVVRGGIYRKESDAVAGALAGIKFLPERVDYLEGPDLYRLTGYAWGFKALDTGDPVPEYGLTPCPMSLDVVELKPVPEATTGTS